MTDPHLAEVIAERRQLINLAYRLLGSLAEAEDVAQETYTRWYALTEQQREAIESPGAWMTTVASRICLDLLGSARARREQYVGDWIPEPLPGGWLDGTGSAPTDPADRVTLDESISMAFLVVLDSMTPTERVSFVLHDVFRYTFPEIAEIVGRTPAACRQLASNARRRLDTERDRSTTERADVVRSFKQAWESQDIEALVGLLDPQAVATADSGGLALAFLEPISGAEQIAGAWMEIATRGMAVTLHECLVNGQPGLVGRLDGATVSVYAFDVADGRITRIWVVRNPEKLRPWSVG
ncbi:sigma-70 family RNA polymerase sigma factor [Nocardioides sp. KC13]|uniref:Sigma-70 family RNA polymerase sigma factor n=1 Tax=Nocardioides turkmenicus TaxID=2711220 RepID=A0A6M1QV65_9ACTN|nr:RNA polymerase sigma factor SigJ [Nocardioides sp. KC13]NGN91620.1 sigma-70 family RNA polymerase sigma factor [Nocardioides sp. KC13]